MKIRYLLAASAAALIAATSANAADVVQQAPYEQPVVTVPTFSWTGAYVGAQIGGSWGKAKVNNWDDTSYAGWKSKTSGFIGGLYAGYNFDVGNNFVVGAETDFVWGNVKKNRTTVVTTTAGDYTLASQVKQKWAGATRLRVGYAVDRFLPYLAAGVAYAKVDNSGVNTFGTSSFGYSNSNTLTGWTIGAGVDYAVTDNILVRLEYRYADYGKKTNVYTTPAFGDVAQKIDYKTNDVRVGVAYKF